MELVGDVVVLVEFFWVGLDRIVGFAICWNWFGFPTFLGFVGVGLVWFSNFSPECRQPLETERTRVS